MYEIDILAALVSVVVFGWVLFASGVRDQHVDGGRVGFRGRPIVSPLLVSPVFLMALLLTLSEWAIVVWEKQVADLWAYGVPR